MDLFAAAAHDRLQSRAPLAARLRPRNLDEIAGQEQLLGAGRPLRTLIESDRLTSVVLWGPPGTGKTSIARLIAGATQKAFEPLSAVSAGVKDVREVAERARQRLGEHGQGTILFLDEVHRFSRTQQDALLPHVEEGLIVLVGATTENPYFSLTAPLLSRSTLFRLEPVGPDALRVLVERALADAERGLGDSGLTIEAEALEHLVDRSEGDARHALTSLDVAAALAGESGAAAITLGNAETALAMRALRYGDDEHYDVISAFIKSIRGSDVDAALYWLARMLEAGEDPRFIARRLVILASEDVGLADSTALPIATAAAHAVEYVGLPEARYNLAHAVIHLANAPKSNRADDRDRRRAGRCGRPAGRGRPDPPAGRQLQGRPILGPRRGVRLSSRLARWLGSPAVPAARGGRPALLGAERHRRGPGPPPRRRAASEWGRGVTTSRRRGSVTPVPLEATRTGMS